MELKKGKYWISFVVLPVSNASSECSFFNFDLIVMPTSYAYMPQCPYEVHRLRSTEYFWLCCRPPAPRGRSRKVVWFEMDTSMWISKKWSFGDWWGENHTSFPLVARLARRILATQVSGWVQLAVHIYQSALMWNMELKGRKVLNIFGCVVGFQRQQWMLIFQVWFYCDAN